MSFGDEVLRLVFGFFLKFGQVIFMFVEFLKPLFLIDLFIMNMRM